MDEHFYAVIMAGGGGTRLWPLSRQERPKQMLPLISSQSLFQEAVRRLNGLFPPERIFVVTTAKMAEEFQLQCPEIPPTNYLLEPQPRGTASVVGLASVVLQTIDPQAVIATLTSDHYIGNIELYWQLLRSSLEVARQNYLVTLGITPTFPATGYGYIQYGVNIGNFKGMSAFEVKRFKEKPDLDTARQMLASGSYAWNSGMFVWQAQSILNEFQRQMPTLYSQLQTIAKAWDSEQRQNVMDKIWPQIETNTIDYGIMEGANQVAVIPAAGLQWNDVGSWESLFEILPGDEAGNLFLPNQSVSSLMLDTKNTLIQSEVQERLIVTIGVEDLVIVDTGDVLLVCKKDHAQKVRQAVDQLKTSHPDRV
jgi:mannose-1-phosphate guanylyltransferase